jgi:hypothetical protein
MTTPSADEPGNAAVNIGRIGSLPSRGLGQQILNDPGGAGAVAGSVGSAFRSPPSTVFVNLGAAAAAANIARDGVTVPILTIDPSRLIAAMPNFTLLEDRVVAQSVAPGTPVPKGTSIDLVLASPLGLPVGIVPNTHSGLQQQTMQSLYQTMVAPLPAIRGVLARNATPDTLSTDDKAAIQGVLSQNDIGVDDTNPATSFAAAFTALQAAATFATPTSSVSSGTSGFGQLFS